MQLPTEIAKLPVASVLEELRRALATKSNAVLQAEPGAGKTTGVPLALSMASWLDGQRIIMLEPRRLAARAAAWRMADLLGEDVGNTVGYRMRLDNREGPQTKILVVTEGILTRMLHKDPALEGIGLIIFDEYHERSLNADLGLASCLDIQQMWRPELRILVMSATLETERIAAILGEATTIHVEGRLFPVETSYVNHRKKVSDVARQVVAAVQQALRNDSSSILVFLPGAREIRRVHRSLKNSELAENGDVAIHPLYGSLPRKAQLEAIAPPASGLRKVVLATDIAETSLTIEGVRLVIDSGLRRTPRFDPRTGMTRLETTRISQASADQRRGRAGRVGPGRCYRLWTAAEHAVMPAFDEPEILNADMAPLVLNLADWGVTAPNSLRWLDAPPDGAFAQARQLLQSLQALDDKGKITRHGRAIQALGAHPRLGHMLLHSVDIGVGATACFLAALLAERDILRSRAGQPLPNIELRLQALEHITSDNPRYSSRIAGMEIDRGACRHVRQIAQRWRRQLGIKHNAKARHADAGPALAFAYPDRIARKRPGRSAHFHLSNGRGAMLSKSSPLLNSDFLVVASIDDKGPDAVIRLAAPLTEDDLLECFQDSIECVASIAWDSTQKRVQARDEWRLGELLIKRAPLIRPDPAKTTAALLQGIREEGIECLPWTRDTRNWQARVLFLRRTFGDEWPDVTDAALFASLEKWLSPFVKGLTRLDELRRIDLTTCLSNWLTWRQKKRLESLAPTHITVPSGSRIRLDYESAEVPVLPVRLQEMFGARETPQVAGGRVPVLVKLLSPAQRPVQVTRDLENFWNETYEQVRKDLYGRYPRHYWPENPWTATPTRRTKPRRS